MATKKFVNGFESWRDTFYEITQVITDELLKPKTESKIINERHEREGTPAMWELATELADKFEMLNKGRVWDGEFYDEVEAFAKEELFKEN